MLTFSEQLCQYWKNYFVCYSTTKTLIIMRAHFHIMSQCVQGPWLLFHSWFILIIINVKCMLMPRCTAFILLSPHSILLSQHKVDHRLFIRILIEFPSSPNLHNTTTSTNLLSTEVQMRFLVPFHSTYHLFLYFHVKT